MDFTTLAIKADGPILTVTLKNGETNVMSATMCAEIFALVGELAMNGEVKVVIFESANSDFFIAHFDLNDILDSLSDNPSGPTSKYPDINILQSLSLSIQALPQVTIAKINGACRGGGFEFMLSMDMAFATEKARFCFPEASVGFLPGGGGTTFLPIKAGKGRALEIMLTGRDFSGSEAAQYNVVNQVFSDEESLNKYVQEAAACMAANNAAAIQAVKAVLGKTTKVFTDGIMAALAQENESMVSCLSDPEVLKQLHKLAKNSGTYETEIDLPKTIRELR